MAAQRPGEDPQSDINHSTPLARAGFFYTHQMDTERPAPLAGYAKAWLIVFAATVVSDVLAYWSVMIVWSASRGWSRAIPSLSSFRAALHMTVFAILFAGLAGLISATICALLLRSTPTRRIVWPIFVSSVVVGVLTAPVFQIYSALMVIIAQIFVSIMLGAPESDDEIKPVDDEVCQECLYSLAGLDRSRTDVCPECGVALHPLPQEKSLSEGRVNGII